MATYEELSKRNSSKKIVAAIIRFIEYRDSINFETYGAYYKVPVANHVDTVRTTTTELTKGSDKDSLSANEWFYEDKVLYINVSPQGLYIREKLFLSSDYIVLKENITSGDLVPFEPRIDSLPEFERDIDPLENDGYSISSFSIKINNKDNAFFDEFNNGIFKNQLCEIYSIIEPDEIDDSEIKKIATAIVDEVDLDDDTGTIKLKEDTKLNGQQTTEFVKSTTENNFPIILGMFNKYLPIQDSDNDYVDTGIDVNYSIVAGTQGASFIGLGTTLEADRIYKFCYPDVRISFSPNQSNTFFSGKITEILSNGRVKLQLDGNILLVGYDEDLRLYVHKDDYILYKNNIKITNIFNGNTGVDTGIGAILSEVADVDDNYLSINQNFSFLKENDVITYDNGTGKCDLVVDYWDNINRRIYLKEGIPYKSTNISTESVFYDYTQTLHVSDNYNLNRRRSRFVLAVGVASTLNSSGAGSYFIMEGRTFNYYIWFNVDGGNTDPSPAGTIAGYECAIDSGDSQQTVMSKLLTTINTNIENNFTATRSNQEEPTGPVSIEIQINDYIIDYRKRSLTLTDMSATGGARVGWAVNEDKLKVKPAFSVDYLDDDPNSVELIIDEYAPNIFEYTDGYNPAISDPYERAILQSTNAITLNSTSDGLKDRRKVIATGNEFSDVEEGDIFLLEYSGQTYPFTIAEVIDDNNIYLHTTASPTGSTYTTTGETWRLLDRLEVENQDVSITGSFSSPNYSSVVRDLMQDHYSLTTNEFLDSSLNDIDTNYSYINIGLIISEKERLYKHINKLNQIMNFVTFVNNNGLIEFKNIHFKAPAFNTIEFSECYKSDNKIFNNIKKEVIYKHSLDSKEDSYTEKTLNSSFLNDMQTFLNLTESTEFESSLMQDIFTQSTGNNRTYEAEIKEKYFNKFSEVELHGSLNLLNYDIGSVVNLDGFPKINSAIDYIVVQVRTNGFSTRLKLLGIIDIFDIEASIVDENGNLIVSELDDEIVS